MYASRQTTGTASFRSVEVEGGPRKIRESVDRYRVETATKMGGRHSECACYFVSRPNLSLPTKPLSHLPTFPLLEARKPKSGSV